MSKTATMAPPVLAAGAICWRIVDGKVRILLVHRGDRADVSLPKGKLDPGETLPQTAVREIEEETGLAVHLGAPLGTVEYTLSGGRDKIVYYWAAEVSEHALQLAHFTPNSEIASLEWTTIAKARKKLSFQHDVALVDRFVERVEARTARTFAIIALRHGKAVDPSMWDGPDSTRPLMQRGQDQAVSIAPGISAYAPTRIISSTATRCQATVAPLAQLTGLDVRTTADISQDAYERGKSAVPSVVAKRLKKRTTTVLCSHGPVLPELVSEIAHLAEIPVDHTLRGAASLSTGEYTVIHMSHEGKIPRIVAVETHGPA